MIPVFDGHNDTLIASDHADFATGRAGGHLDLPRMRSAGVRAAVFAVWTEGDDWPATPVPNPDAERGIRWDLPAPVPYVTAAGPALRVAGRLAALDQAGHVRLARDAATLDRAYADDGPPAAILHLEGAEPIDPDLEALDHWYGAGLRSVGITWSRPTAFGHGVPFTAPGDPDTGPGLSAAGRRLIGRCAELGILVDLAHLNEAGFWDVARAEVGPLVVSHTAAHALAPLPRNLTDAQLDAVGDSHGLVAIVYGTRFLGADFEPRPEMPLGVIAQHARYVADRIGYEHVGLGSDFDGTDLPDALRDVTGVPRLLDALSTVGFTDDEVAAIAWHNWRRVIGAWWRD